MSTVPVARLILATVVVVLAGGIIGSGSAWWIAGQERWLGGAEVGGWRTNTLIGATEAGPYVRAVTARIGLMALNRDEAIYYFRDRDGQGRRLRAACRYRLVVPPLRARWWSLTIYDQDDYLARNDDQAHAVGVWDLEEPAARGEVLIGPAPAPDSLWLSTRNAGRFSLILRLYHPEAGLVEAPESLAAPKIDRLDCPGSPA